MGTGYGPCTGTCVCVGSAPLDVRKVVDDGSCVWRGGMGRPLTRVVRWGAPPRAAITRATAGTARRSSIRWGESACKFFSGFHTTVNVQARESFQMAAFRVPCFQSKVATDAMFSATDCPPLLLIKCRMNPLALAPTTMVRSRTTQDLSRSLDPRRTRSYTYSTRLSTSEVRRGAHHRQRRTAQSPQSGRECQRCRQIPHRHR